jgi:hypothetical protein
MKFAKICANLLSVLALGLVVGSCCKRNRKPAALSVQNPCSAVR